MFKTLAIFGSILAIFVVIGFLITGNEMANAKALNNEYAARPNVETTGYVLWGIGAVLLIFAIFQLVTAIGIGKLLPQFRIPTFIVLFMWLLNFPVGTFLAAYFFMHFTSAEGKYILTPEYKMVMQQTPEITSKSGLIVKAIVVITIVLAVGSVIMVLLP